MCLCLRRVRQSFYSGFAYINVHDGKLMMGSWVDLDDTSAFCYIALPVRLLHMGGSLVVRYQYLGKELHIQNNILYHTHIITSSSIRSASSHCVGTNTSDIHHSTADASHKSPKRDSTRSFAQHKVSSSLLVRNLTLQLIFWIPSTSL